MSRRKSKKSRSRPRSDKIARQPSAEIQQDTSATTDEDEVLPAELVPDEGAPGAFVARRSLSWRGPLPPPEILEKFDALVPGSAEKIISWVSDESEHRRALEKQTLFTFAAGDRRGTWMAFTLAMFVSGGAFYLMATGVGLVGLGALIAELAVLAGVFIMGRRNHGGPPDSDT